jgi:hypothetical protein
MKNIQINKRFIKKTIDHGSIQFSIFCSINYISENIEKDDYYFLIIIFICLIAGSIFTLFNINIYRDKNERA